MTLSKNFYLKREFKELEIIKTNTNRHQTLLDQRLQMVLDRHRLLAQQKLLAQRMPLGQGMPLDQLMPPDRERPLDLDQGMASGQRMLLDRHLLLDRVRVRALRTEWVPNG